jgi:hypothetical protein
MDMVEGMVIPMLAITIAINLLMAIGHTEIAAGAVVMVAVDIMAGVAEAIMAEVEGIITNNTVSFGTY